MLISASPRESDRGRASCVWRSTCDDGMTRYDECDGDDIFLISGGPMWRMTAGSGASGAGRYDVDSRA